MPQCVMDDLSKWLGRASRALHAGAFDCAVAALAHVVDIEPYIPTWWAALASSQLKTNQADEAAASLSQLVELNPDCVEALCVIGMIEADRGNLEAARVALLRCVQLDGQVHHFVLLGDVEDRLGLKTDAQASFRSAFEKDPQNTEALLGLALVLRRSHPDEAKVALEQALTIEPRLAPACRELGYLRIADGKPKEAVDLLDRALRLDASDPWTHVYMGVAASRIGDSEKAKMHYLEAASLDNTLALPLRFVADVYRREGAIADAVECYRRAVARDPNDLRALTAIRELTDSAG